MLTLKNLQIGRTKSIQSLFEKDIIVDERAFRITEIDFANVTFENGLVGDEMSIDGKEKLERLRKRGILLDTQVAQALLLESEQLTLRYLHVTFGVSHMEFLGNVFWDEGQDRAMSLERQSKDGRWYEAYYAMACHPGEPRVTPVLWVA